MSRRNEHSFDEIQYARPSAHTLRGARQYKLTEIGEFEAVGRGWQQTLGFVSEVAGGGEAKVTIRAKKRDGLTKLLGLIQTIEQIEQLAAAQYRSGDVNKADFNRETGVRLRQKVRDEGVHDLPEREWKWENNQLIYRGQQKMF